VRLSRVIKYYLTWLDNRACELTSNTGAQFTDDHKILLRLSLTLWHRRGTREAVAPQQNWGATSTSCCPIFSVTYSFRDCKVTFDTKNSRKFPSFWGFAPDTIVHCVYVFRKKYILHIICIFKVILWIWLSWLLLSFFASPTKKVVQFLPPNRKIVPAPMPCELGPWSPRPSARVACKTSVLRPRGTKPRLQV